MGTQYDDPVAGPGHNLSALLHLLKEIELVGAPFEDSETRLNWYVNGYPRQCLRQIGCFAPLSSTVGFVCSFS